MACEDSCDVSDCHAIWGAQPARGSPRKVSSRKGSERPLRGSLWGLCGALRGSVWIHRIFRGLPGRDPMFQLCDSEMWRANLKARNPEKWRVTLLVGIEMSFLGYRDFSIFFSVSRFSTSNLQDVEARKSTHGLIPGRRRSRCWTTESRCQKSDLDTKKET